MKFKVSDRSAVQVTDVQAAVEFYGGALGLRFNFWQEAIEN